MLQRVQLYGTYCLVYHPSRGEPSIEDAQEELNNFIERRTDIHATVERTILGELRKEDLSAYEYCVNEAKFSPTPELNAERRTATTPEGFVFVQPRNTHWELLHSEGRPKATHEPGSGWEYVRHDCVATHDDVTVLVTWRRPKTKETT